MNQVVAQNKFPFPVSDALQKATDELVAVIGVNPLLPVFQKAAVVIAVRNWLAVPEVMDKIIKLKNTPAGFLTDEDSRGTNYDEKVVANCVAEALIGGFDLVNNEFNIIAGKFMGVLNGYFRKVATFENDKLKVLGLEVVEGDIAVVGNMVKVPMKIHYSYQDKSQPEGAPAVKAIFDQVIQLTQKSRDTADAWIGKAQRRALKKLYVRLSGFDPGDDLGDEATAGAGPAAGSVPPSGVTSTAPAKPKPPAPEAPVASEATFTEIIGKGAPAAPEAAPAPAAAEATPPPPQEPAAEGKGSTKPTKTGKPPVDAF